MKYRHLVAHCVLAWILCWIWLPVYGSDAPIEIFVSILPQKWFVERIGGTQVKVHVMVGPGHSPATYEPSPKQMATLAHSDIYFRIGTPFEKVWMDRIKAANPHLIVINATEAVTLRDMERTEVIGDTASRHHDHDHGLKDPHIWTDPLTVKKFMEQFTARLIDLYPSRGKFFNAQYRQLEGELENLDTRIRSLMEHTSTRYILVFHPTWGYFTDRYGLQQVPIESQGKEPSARQLATLIDFAKQNKIKYIYVQKQFSRKNAQAVAQAIGGELVSVDPLAEDYVNNLWEVARLFAGNPL